MRPTLDQDYTAQRELLAREYGAPVKECLRVIREILQVPIHNELGQRKLKSLANNLQKLNGLFDGSDTRRCSIDTIRKHAARSVEVALAVNATYTAHRERREQENAAITLMYLGATATGTPASVADVLRVHFREALLGGMVAAFQDKSDDYLRPLVDKFDDVLYQLYRDNAAEYLRSANAKLLQVAHTAKQVDRSASPLGPTADIDPRLPKRQKC